MRISDWSSDVCSSDLPDDLLEMGGGCAPDAGLAQPIPLNRGATNRFTAALPAFRLCDKPRNFRRCEVCRPTRSEEHTSELQSLMRISYAVFCLHKKKHITSTDHDTYTYHTKHKHK